MGLRSRCAALLLLLLVLVLVLAVTDAFRPGPNPSPLGPAPARAAASAAAEQDQRMRLLFPPTRRPTSIVFQDPRRGIWTFEQPFFTTTDIKTRMTLLDLGGGTLLLYAPIAATTECIDMVQRVTNGRLPTHIVMHSDAIDHTIFLAGWRRALPQAEIWATNPDRSKGDRPLVVVNERTGRLEAQLPPALTQSGMLEAAVFDSRPLFQEVVLYHKPSRSLLCADAIWRVVSPRFSPNVIAASGWVGFGVAGCSRHPYWFYFPRRRKEEVRDFVTQIQAWGEVDRVLPGHLDAIPTEGEEGMSSEEVKRVFLGSFDYIVL